MNLLVRAYTLVNPLCMNYFLLLSLSVCLSVSLWVCVCVWIQETKKRNIPRHIFDSIVSPSDDFVQPHVWLMVRARAPLRSPLPPRTHPSHTHTLSQAWMINVKVRDPTLDCHHWWCGAGLYCLKTHTERKRTSFEKMHSCTHRFYYYSRMWFIEISLANKKCMCLLLIHLCRIHLFIFICI